MPIEQDISEMARELRQIGMWVYEFKTGLGAVTQRIEDMATASDISAAVADAKTAVAAKIAEVDTKVEAVIAALKSGQDDAAALDGVVTEIASLKTDALAALSAVEDKAAAATPAPVEPPVEPPAV